MSITFGVGTMIEVSVCIGSACHIKGAYNVMQTFLQMTESYGLHDWVEIKGAFCMRQCATSGVGVRIDEASFRLNPEEARAFYMEHVLAKAKAEGLTSRT